MEIDIHGIIEATRIRKGVDLYPLAWIHQGNHESLLYQWLQRRYPVENGNSLCPETRLNQMRRDLTQRLLLLMMSDYVNLHKWTDEGWVGKDEGLSFFVRNTGELDGKTQYPRIFRINEEDKIDRILYWAYGSRGIDAAHNCLMAFDSFRRNPRFSAVSSSSISPVVLLTQDVFRNVSYPPLTSLIKKLNARDGSHGKLVLGEFARTREYLKNEIVANYTNI